jgi:hypothetical protein
MGGGGKGNRCVTCKKQILAYLERRKNNLKRAGVIKLFFWPNADPARGLKLKTTTNLRVIHIIHPAGEGGQGGQVTTVVSDNGPHWHLRQSGRQRRGTRTAPGSGSRDGGRAAVLSRARRSAVFGQPVETAQPEGAEH